MEARVYLAVMEPLRLEALLSADSRFSVLGGSGDCGAAAREIESLRPDAVALDMALRGGDALALLRLWRDEWAAPPRVLALCPYREEKWAARLRAAGADRVIGPGDEKRFAAILAETAAAPLPALSAPWAKKRADAAEELLGRLGVSRRLKGRAYMAEAAAALCCAPQLARDGRLYPYLAERCGTTPAAAERAIRTAVEDTWLNGDLEEIQALFGLTVDADRGKPTNRECLMMLAEHVRRVLNRYLQAQKR